MNRHTDDALLERVGTTAEIARLFEVTPQAVHQWRRDGIPRARRQTLRLLRPDLFEPAGEAPAAPILARDAA